MLRPHPAFVSRWIIGGCLSLVGWANANAQTWNDARTRALVEKATALRAEQLADTTLTEYQASAHGYVTFLAQLGRSALLPPKVVKTDELELEIKWHAPNLSKQTIIGRRDTLLLPTDIEYHRDHLGIVQNNFPSIIRIGEGDEVRDVPHPLSARGLVLYDFAITDSLRIRIPGRDVDVYEIKVRPKNDKAPGVIGAVYIDPSGGQVVRMAFNFTHASFLDTSLEDLSVVLENRLVGTRYWLPSRQEIEIRRSLTWMDYPLHGIIRGRWEIGDYDFSVQLPRAVFNGPEIVAAPIPEQRAYQWHGGIMDSLPPDVTAVTEADIARVQTEARSLVRAQALAAVHPTTLSVNSVSDLVHFNRVEGLAVGAGAAHSVGPSLAAATHAHYGVDARDVFGDAKVSLRALSGATVDARGFRELRDVGVVAERSTAVNTIAAQEFGSDFTDFYLNRGGALGLTVPDWGGVEWDASAGFERHDPEVPHARSVTGSDTRYVAVVPAGYWTSDLQMIRPISGWLGGWELATDARITALRVAPSLGAPGSGFASSASWSERLTGHAIVSHDWGGQRTLLEMFGGVAPHAPIEEWIYLGGPVTAPGYGFHALVSQSAASGRAEWQVPTPFPSFSLGRFGRVPARAKIALFGGTALAGGAYPFGGASLITPFDLMRIDVGRGFNHGGWTFSIDVTRDYWGIL